MDCDGVGAFFYQPPIMIMEKKEQLDSELSKSMSPGCRIRKIVLNHSLKNGMRTVATDNGFIGIFEKNITHALKIINTIFATGITWGLGSEYVRELDLCRFSLANDGSQIKLDAMGGPSERNMFSFQRDSDTGLYDWKFIEPKKISTDDRDSGQEFRLLSDTRFE